MAAVRFDVSLRIEPAYRLRPSLSNDDLLGEIKATTLRVAKIGTETTTLLNRIADLESAAAKGAPTAQAIDAVTTQARRLRALTNLEQPG